MGLTKSDLFSDYQNKIATMAKAIGHPARVAILEHIIKQGSCVCGDIVEELPLSQSTVSQHLKAMKEAGIIRGEVNGPYRCYCIDMESCKKLMGHLRNIFSKANCC